MRAPDSRSTFDHLPEVLRTLAGRSELKRFARGQRLIEEGQFGDTLYIIVSGRVRVFSSGEREREITYGQYGAGEYVGEMSLDGGPRSASVEAVEDCLCAMVTRHTLLRHIADHPEFSLELLAKLIRRARAATLSARQLALNDVYGRLTLLLNSMAEDGADGTRVIGVRLTHRDMAHRLGCSREMVSRLFKDLESGGYIVARAGRLVLLRPLPARW